VFIRSSLDNQSFKNKISNQEPRLKR